MTGYFTSSDYNPDFSLPNRYDLLDHSLLVRILLNNSRINFKFRFTNFHTST